MACGTGEPTIGLASRGYKVVRVDLHEEMIEIAREKARRKNLSIEFIVGDTRRLDALLPRGSFDAATMFFSSIAYMTRVEDLHDLFSSIAGILRRGGVFVADTGNPFTAFYRLGSRGENTPITWSEQGERKQCRRIMIVTLKPL